MLKYDMNENMRATTDMSDDDYDIDMYYSSDEEEDNKVESLPVVPVKENVKTYEDIENELKETEEFKKKVLPILNWVKVSSNVSSTSGGCDYDSKFPKLGEKIDKTWVEVKKKTKKEENVKKDIGNTRTRMCSYNKCPHGTNCRFAHSTKELNILECTFDSCKLVRMVNHKYINAYMNKRCERRHKNENDNNFFIRTGIKDPITDEEIKDAYNVFINSYELLTPEMHEIIENCPCDKMKPFFEVSYCGKASPSEPVKKKYIKYIKYKPRKEILQKVVKCKEIKKIKNIVALNVKFQKENPETIYIMKTNEKRNEIKSLKTVITRTQDTITRLKQQKNYSMIKKYEEEYRNKIQKLVILEKEFTEIKIEKIVEIIEEKEEKIEEVKKEEKKKKEKMIILEIILPKKVEVIKEEKFVESSDSDSDIETSIRKIIIPSSVSIQVLQTDDGVGWVSVENKKHTQKNTPPSNTPTNSFKNPPTNSFKNPPTNSFKNPPPTNSFKNPPPTNSFKNPPPTNSFKNIPVNSFKNQMCRSLTTVPNTKCPHGNNCRYAHNINELLCNVKECGFGTLCKLVGKDIVVGEYTNIGYKICSYKHPMETKNSYVRRNKY